MRIDKETPLFHSSDLLNAIRDQFIVSITDACGTIVEVNDTFCSISQYHRHELIGQNHRIINSGHHTRKFFSTMWKTVLSGKAWRGDVCNRAKDGSLYWVDSVISPLRNGQGEIDRFISIRSDITRRKTQEKELRKSEALLDRTGEIAGVGGWEVDLETQAIFWSNETCRLHGVAYGYQPSLDEAIEFYAPEARQIIRNAVETAMETGQGWDIEVPFIRANGERIMVRAAGSVEITDGKATKLIGAFQDITAQVYQRTEIERANARMTLATNSGRIGVWEFDLASNTLIWDAWMYRLYGLSPKTKVEPYALWSSRLHPDDKEKAETMLHSAIQGKSSFDTEFRIVWDDGSVHNIRGTAIVERDHLGTPLKMVGVNWDVTQIHLMTSELEKQRELLQVTLESIGDAVITTDACGLTQWLNPVAQRMTGWSVQEARGRPLGQVFHIINEKTRLRTENPVEMCLSQGKAVGLANHTVLISRTGEEYGIEDSAAPIKGRDNNTLGVVLVFHDVTEQRRLSGEVSYQATHDRLTSLYNRLEFESRLDRLLQRCHSDKSIHILLCIDLDQFKIINDSCGHSIGDAALIQVSKLFTSIIRSRDTLARLGGDEFGIILEHCDDEQGYRIACKICDAMEEFRFIHDGRPFRIGASIGMVSINNSWSTSASLMQSADSACFAAKDAGRNRVHIFNDSDAAIRNRHGEMQWTTRIEHALDEQRFVLYAQRIVPTDAKETGVRAEVLLRMVDENGAIIAPGVFMPAAERFQLVSRIDKWVLVSTLRWLTSLPHKDYVSINTLCINLSGQSVGDRSFHDFVCTTLGALERPLCEKLCIEITETIAITNIVDASLFVERLKQLGVKVALDDFGAGASSFGYLKNFDVDVLKIDGQFIQDLLTDALDAAAVRCFIEVATIVGLKTVAEFVEQDAILEKVKSMGIDYVQGFLLHKPESIDKLTEA